VPDVRLSRAVLAGGRAVTPPLDNLNNQIIAAAERWRVIGDFSDYEVSDHGRVRRITPGRGARAGHILRPGKHGSKDNPHLFVMLRRNGEAFHCAVHRLVAIAFIGNAPFPEARVLHWDDDPNHNHFRNLRWGTSAENAQDRKRNRGWHDLKGAANPAAKLNEDQVIQIRDWLDRGVCGSCIGRIFGVTKETIYAIRHHRIWTEV
jgi:HNH endonuclease